MPLAPTRQRPLARALSGALASGLVRSFALFAALGCGAGAAPRPDGPPPPVDGKLFTRLPSSYTGVRFENRLVESKDMNVFTYRNFYNGGGVALGDLTGDGLPELVLTANQGGPRLYVNEGHFRFRDVTDASGVRTAAGSWTTGVTFADVNGDGRLDLYVCKAGSADAPHRANELWINQGTDADGVPHFKEMAKEYGVADEGWSTQAVFFDYDRDGRLDLLVINNSPKPVAGYAVLYSRQLPDPYSGAKLYHNDGARGGAGHPHFSEVTQRSGIFSPQNAFGLGLAVGDVNRDGWPDVYVSNDFYERDYLYLNNGDGTFTEAQDRAMPVGSYYSMGLDVADVDNDGWPDVYTTDMLPQGEERLRTMGAFEGWDVYQSKVRNGYGHQLMRNMLQHNNGVGPATAGANGLTFSDVGEMAGVARTDWSWSALIADFDLDGRKDIYVTNGLARDVTSQDFIVFQANETERARQAAGGAGSGAVEGGVDYLNLTRAMPATPLRHYAFRNEGGPGAALAFTDQAAAWGLDARSFANGAAYGDLDGDGAPDLVVNNSNGEAFVYRNNARAVRRGNHFLQVRLEGEGENRFGVGARVTAYAGRERLVQEEFPTRGFESSVDLTLTFGLGARALVDSLVVEWPDGRLGSMTNVAADRRVTARHADARAGTLGPAFKSSRAPAAAGLLAAVADSTALDWVHRESPTVDFDGQPLAPKTLTMEGPALAVADVNGDGLDDVFLGGARGQPGRLMLQRADGRFAAADSAVFAPDAASDDVGALFFDADGDGRPDLYVVSGGSGVAPNAPELQDRLYLNDGRGHFRRAPANSLPSEHNSGSRAAAADYDGNGTQDVFVGGRVVPGQYGVAPRSMLLRNDGRGHFSDVTDRLAPELARVGMVTDAVWRDVDGDGRPDLVVVGEWMPITVFHNEGGGRLKKWSVPGLAKTHGWWNRIIAFDTGTGRVSFVVGNLGLNTRLRASEREPAELFVKDFNGNGIVQPILSYYNGGARWPLPLRDELLRAIPSLKPRYTSYRTYGAATLDSVFPPAKLAGAVADTAYTFASALVRNDGVGPDGAPRFTVVPLPAEAQVAPVYGLLADDVDGDGKLDLVLGGNFDGFKPEIGRAAASYGLVLRGDGAGHFTPLRAAESGFCVPGQTRDVRRVRARGGALYVVARNGDRPLLFRSQHRAPRAGTTLAQRMVGRRTTVRGS